MDLKKPLVVIAAVVGLAACGGTSQPGLARQSRTTSMKDFTPERADGRTAKAMAWARKKQADAAKPPAHPFLKDRESFLAW